MACHPPTTLLGGPRIPQLISLPVSDGFTFLLQTSSISAQQSPALSQPESQKQPALFPPHFSEQLPGVVGLTLVLKHQVIPAAAVWVVVVVVEVVVECVETATHVAK